MTFHLFRSSSRITSASNLFACFTILPIISSSLHDRLLYRVVTEKVRRDYTINLQSKKITVLSTLILLRMRNWCIRWFCYRLVLCCYFLIVCCRTWFLCTYTPQLIQFLTVSQVVLAGLISSKVNEHHFIILVTLRFRKFLSHHETNRFT